jgi:hypothetical protein
LLNLQGQREGDRYQNFKPESELSKDILGKTRKTLILSYFSNGGAARYFVKPRCFVFFIFTVAAARKAESLLRWV